MHTSDSSLRRRARAQGLELVKYRPSSRWYAQYGPYALVEQSTNCLEAYGLSREEVAAALR